MEPAALSDLIDATWPAAEVRDRGPWRLRRGAGGGSRVSAATATQVLPADSGSPLAEAESAMRTMGQTPLFMVRAGEDTLDAALAERGYAVRDPTALYLAPVEVLAAPDPGGVYLHWPPLAIQREIWAEGGIGPDRLSIMDRVAGPRASILGRLEMSPAGTGFVAVHGGTAMLHALEVRTGARRQGLGRRMVSAAARWAAAQGARDFAILVTKANTSANSLYAGLGASLQSGYHYRVHP